MQQPFHFDHSVPRLIMTEELENARQLIINHIRANGQNASGKTIQSLRVEASEENGILWGHRPFGVLETGRKAGKIPYGFAGIIYQWMKDKGVHATPVPYLTDRPHKYSEQERADRKMASAIAHTIAKKGSALHRKGSRNDVYSNVVPQTLARIRTRLITLIKGEVSHIVINN